MSLSVTPPTRRCPLTRNPRVTRENFDLSPQAGRGERPSLCKTFLSLDGRQVREAPARQAFLANATIFPGQPCLWGGSAGGRGGRDERRSLSGFPGTASVVAYPPTGLRPATHARAKLVADPHKGICTCVTI